jgi:SAM-dependent methyltransferase
MAADAGDILHRSWSAFAPERAAEYLRSSGHPSPNSKLILADVLLRLGRSASVMDLGCGNAHLLEFLRDRGFRGRYVGVEFSEPLLGAARRAFAHDPQASFLHGDVNTLESVDVCCDVAIYSHVIEMLASPERSLLAARRLADKILIRFFEPPDHEFDSVEIHSMKVGPDESVPYLRRKMGRDYYRLILARLGCSEVDVYQDEHARDQVHVLHYQGSASGTA